MAEMGLAGLEFAVGIPGTVGGGVVTNAGAHGGDWGRRIVWVEGVAADGAVRRLAHDELDFRYRHSTLPESFVVTEALLQLVPDDPERVLATTRHYLEERRAKQPLNYPNAGCFFKNPPGAHAGKLIEEAGLKGLRVGNLEVSSKHANFIVNLGGGTARDALALVDAIRERVHAAHGVWVETEVMVVGEDAR
jgi:UDP-N-acetylmuramate dehydrogenase